MYVFLFCFFFSFLGCFRFCIYVHDKKQNTKSQNHFLYTIKMIYYVSKIVDIIDNCEQ